MADMHRGKRLLAAAGMLSLLVGLAAPARIGAQDDKQPLAMSWDDAPVVPWHRSKADWLIDVGWQSHDDLYGPPLTRDYQVGDSEQFIPLLATADQRILFTLRLRSEHAYFWFDEGVTPDSAALERSARIFEERIWPLNHSIYGEGRVESPDGGSRIHIVNQSAIAPGIQGAFNPEDQCPRSLCLDSNQRAIVYINLGTAPLGSEEYLTTLAHEHQHLIQFHVDGNERRWFNEALSQLAEHLNGFHPRYVGHGNVIDFLSTPDHPLRGWSNHPREIARYYGAGYLFMVYLYERFGIDLIRRVARSPWDELASVQQALVESGSETGVDDVFADWIVANYLDDPRVGDGRYFYQSLDLPVRIEPQPLPLRRSAALHTDSVQQYGADYLSLTLPGRYQLSFDGSDSVSVMEALPRSGEWMWWSYNGTNGAARLTAAFDLSGLSQATLAFSAWWHIEDDYDWFQVLVSGNDGQDWSIARGEKAARDGLFAPGAYYSGQSGAWIDERIDLSAFAGSAVLVRFEYLTDATDSGPGVALDDIGIVELRQMDDVESMGSVWQPSGFLRMGRAFPQNWAAKVVLHPPEGIAQVLALPLDALHTGRLAFDVLPGGSATIIVGAMAPFSVTPATYKLEVKHAP